MTRVSARVSGAATTQGSLAPGGSLEGKGGSETHWNRRGSEKKISGENRLGLWGDIASEKGELKRNKQTDYDQHREK